MTEKRCNKCGCKLSISDFFERRLLTDGHGQRPILCNTCYRRELYGVGILMGVMGVCAAINLYLKSLTFAVVVVFSILTIIGGYSGWVAVMRQVGGIQHPSILKDSRKVMKRLPVQIITQIHAESRDCEWFHPLFALFWIAILLLYVGLFIAYTFLSVVLFSRITGGSYRFYNVPVEFLSHPAILILWGIIIVLYLLGVVYFMLCNSTSKNKRRRIDEL